MSNVTLTTSHKAAGEYIISILYTCKCFEMKHIILMLFISGHLPLYRKHCSTWKQYYQYRTIIVKTSVKQPHQDFDLDADDWQHPQTSQLLPDLESDIAKFWLVHWSTQSSLSKKKEGKKTPIWDKRLEPHHSSFSDAFKFKIWNWSCKSVFLCTFIKKKS